MTIELKGPIPDRVKSLPLDDRGYAVPWFVQWVDGKPIFPVMDQDKWGRAVKERLCWICGQQLGGYLCFVSGPMCGITRTTAEPPSHRECAEFSLRNCPFLVNPGMKRTMGEPMEGFSDAPGIMIKRNPGVSLLWVTRRYSLARIPEGGYIIKMGDPVEVQCWARGRNAEAQEVRSAITSGCPALVSLARQDGDKAMAELRGMRVKFLETIGMSDLEAELLEAEG